MRTGNVRVTRPATRARLLSLLSEACELEHAVACSYLYAAFSIKRDIAEGIDWREQQRNRRWASQLYDIAAQEMLHLAQVWNLLTAVGGTPYYARPNYPLPARWYPLKVALVLRRFDLATIERFVYYEAPAHNVKGQPALPPPPAAAWPIDESFPYTSVGQLYREIRSTITALDERELFVANPARQVGQALIDFYDVLAVKDADSAAAAIDRITLQGEGTTEDREDAHYGVFTAIEHQLKELSLSASDPARPVADNPYIRRRRDQIPAAFVRPTDEVRMTEITDLVAIEAVDLFDDAYVAMLQALAYVFGNTDSKEPLLPRIARSSLELMTTVLKPLGESICQLPSGQRGLNAGPTFGMSRHAQLPPGAEVTSIVYGERLAELADHAGLLVDAADRASWAVQDQLRGAAANLRRLAGWFGPAT